MIPFDVVTRCFNAVGNSRRVITFRKGLKMFRFPIVKSSFGFSDVKIIAGHCIQVASQSISIIQSDL